MGEERGCAFRSAAQRWHFDSRADRLQDTAASGTAGNQPQHRTRNAASTECGAFYSSTPRSGLAAPRPRFPPRAAPTARRACTGRYYRPCSSITGMSEVAEVPAPVAGLPTARSPGRTPSAEFISCKYKGEKGELSVPGPLRHSYVRRATAHAHTIPNLKPEIWTKHCVTPSSISYVSYFISLSSLSLSLLEPDQSSSMYGDFGVMISGRRKARADRSERVH